MSKPEADFSMDELLRELEAALPQEGGITTRELAEKLGLGRQATLRRIRELKKLGRIELCRKRIRDITDRWLTVTAWRLAK